MGADSLREGNYAAKHVRTWARPQPRPPKSPSVSDALFWRRDFGPNEEKAPPLDQSFEEASSRCLTRQPRKGCLLGAGES